MDGEAQAAIESIFKLKGSGYRFPSDQVWAYFNGHPPESRFKPSIISRLAKNGFIVPTGRTTRAVTGPRAGSPTTEYTFGPVIDPSSSINAQTAAPDPQMDVGSEYEKAEHDQNAIPENREGSFPLQFPLQRLVHGCPGSGKSYLLQKDGESAHFLIRTVFHPESSYSDFVGGLRPQSIYKILDPKPEFIGSTIEVPGEPFIQYVVQTGPLLKAYQLACRNPKKSVVLIIEELSRAVASHVFGDTLQLLDRVEEAGSPLSGYSSYAIEPRPDIGAWLTLNEVWNDEVGPGSMRFPPNLYIWATMNRADQNARQLDAAFLRRWRKQYISHLQVGALDETPVQYAGENVSWRRLRSFVNTRLLETEGIPEDKLVGPYMLPIGSLSDPQAIYEDLWGYLWNDVLKSRASSVFQGVQTFAEVRELWADGKGAPIGSLPADA